MAEQRVERRLTAILAGDVAGYSRLMGADEEGTLSRLNAHRREFLEPKIAEHHGRIVKRTGDGILLEFASAVDATRCAVEIQRGMIERNAPVPQDRRIELRIGIHVGDIIIEEGDIFGDGVNIAARLESIARPSGICISDDAYRQVRDRLDATFQDAGEQELKNIARPVRVYQLQLAGAAPEALVQEGLAPALPDKPSIAVLPFQNMSGDPEQDYFADGIVEDIITGLSRFKWLFVIARNSTFVYKGQALDVKKVGRELGVRYLVEGSVRKAGNRIRITGQLIDASTGAHVWAERYDGALDDIFELQDRITASVIGAVEPNLRQAEIERAKRKRPDSLDAYDLYLRAFPHAYANTPEDSREALRLLEQALRLEPTYAAAHAIAAWCHEQLYSRAGFREESKIAALRHGASAIAYGADDATALCMAGFAMAMVTRDFDAGISAIDRSLALNTSYAAGFAYSALLRAFAGQYEMAIEHALQAIRLNPLDPMGAQPYISLVFAYLPLGRFEEAAAAAAKAVQLNPRFSIAHAEHIIALVKLGRMEAARAAAGRLLELMPEFKVDMLTRVASAPSEILADWAQALRSAGIPG
jgi:TolB-like protein/class 3 adenylate cyclase/Flp pilus assembly protein TadD